LFASPYPWGWLPYRYGNWMFIPPFGWMWQPGAWNNWQAVPRYTATTLTTVHPLVAPTGTVKTVVVGRGGSATAGAMPYRMTLRAGSAGMGIARGSLENLKGLNRQVAKAGFAEVHAAPQFAASSPPSSGFGAPSGGATAASSAGHASSGAHASGGGATGHR
jgi:hypothetical protein